MRRLALASILLAACVNDSPMRAPSPASVRVSIATAITGQTGQADRSIAIRAFYRRNGGGEVDLTVSPDRLVLQSATTSERSLTVAIGACFDDELREQAAGDGCVLYMSVQLLGADGLALSGDQQQLTVSPNGTTDASLAFVLTAPDILLTPGSVSFTAIEQSTAPNAARVAVSGSSGLVLGTLSATTQFTGAANWLSATIATTNEVVLQVTTTNLQPGTHAAVVTVRSSRADIPPRDIAVTFNVTARPPQALNLTVQGSGNGVVTSLPAGLNCTRLNNQNTGTCTFAFAFGTQVALSATLAQGHTFTGWGGACSGTGACIVAMNQVQNVTATFTAPPPQQLNVTLAGTGGGSVTSAPAGINCTRSNNQNSGTCGTAFAFGAQVTLTPTPAQGHTFSGWGGDCSGTGACIVTTNQVRNVSATFDAPAIAVAPASLSFTAAAGGNPVPATGTFQVTNTGAGALNWTAAETAPWFAVTPASGVLTAGQSQTVTVTVTSSTLPAGNYADSIVVSAPGIASRQVAVTLSVMSLAPTISNLAVTLRQVNDSANCGNGGSSFIASFNFSDPDGDVTMALARIRSNFTFSQGTSGTVNWPTPGFFYSVTGNGFSGTASMFLCTVFANSTSITNTFTLFDGAGRVSNALSVTTFKPPGSN